MSLLAASCAALAVLCWRGMLRSLAVRERLVPEPLNAPAARRHRPRTSSRVLRRRRAECVVFAAGVAAELAAGAPWESALQRAADGDAVVAPLREASHPQAALRRLAPLPGAEGLGALVAVGDLSLQTGASAARLADRVAQVLRADDRARRAVDVELAAALATARLLATLPAVGLLMGAAVGADPVAVLVRSGPGRACAAGAALLEVAGIVWCRRIRRRAVR